MMCSNGVMQPGRGTCTSFQKDHGNWLQSRCRPVPRRRDWLEMGEKHLSFILLVVLNSRIGQMRMRCGAPFCGFCGTKLSCLCDDAVQVVCCLSIRWGMMIAVPSVHGVGVPHLPAPNVLLREGAFPRFPLQCVPFCNSDGWQLASRPVANAQEKVKISFEGTNC